MKLCTFITIFVVIGVNILTYTHSAKILGIFPYPSHSHHEVLHVLTEELAKDGHCLVVMTTKMRKNPIENVTEIDVGAVSYKIVYTYFEDLVRNHDGFGIDHFTFWHHKFQLWRNLLNEQIRAQKMQQLINDTSQEFDLIICESNIRMGLTLRARFKAPVITVSTFGGSVESFKTVGAETDFLFYPELTATSTANRQFWNRVSELIRNLKFQWLFFSTKFEEDIVIRQHFGDNAPKMNELQKKIEMLFLNGNRLWDENRPAPLSVVYMGALSLKKPDPLPKDLQNYLDHSKNGVIYFSLGSIAKPSMLPQRAMDVIKTVFATLPYDIIWKWGDSDMPNKPKNVRLENWLPQKDLLHHPRVKAFITHGGLQSTNEAIAANVPMIGLPMFSDQWQNSELYQKLGIGFMFDVNHLEENNLRNAILEVAEAKRYRDNMRHLSQAIAEQRSRSGARAAMFWVRHLTTHGGRHLRSPLADVTTIEFYMIDLVVITLVLVSISCYAIIFIVKRLKDWLTKN